MNTFHIHHQFHAVGHGTFFTGLLRDEGSQDKFSWIYDCGATPVSRIRDAVADYSKWMEVQSSIDLVIVSHFDRDHVNGLEHLLLAKKVKVLALPYIGFQERFALASSLKDESAAVFALDPLAFLSTTNLSANVGTLLFIEGGSNEANSTNESLPLPTPDDARNNSDDLGREGGFEDQYGSPVALPRSSPQLKVKIQSDKTPSSYGKLPWEFVFYNSFPKSQNKIVSGASLGDIRTEVKAILKGYDVLRGKPTSGWKNKLKECYSKHFGSSGPQKNNLSLCVLARPTIEDCWPEPCSLFKPMRTSYSCSVVNLALKSSTGLLLTGDISLSHRKVQAMAKHFQRRRWDSIAVMQIPHHGSELSWDIGTAAGCNHAHSVFCVPNSSSKHPHPQVKKDLGSHGPVHANLMRSVAVQFHFAY